MKKLTNQSKYLIYGTMFISGMVILTAIIFVVISKKANTNANLWIMGTMILIALATVGFMFYLRKVMKQRAKLLNDEYYTVYEKILDMMQASALSYLERRETRNDLLGLLIDAQNSGRNVSDITGDNLEVFVRQVQDSFGYRNRILFQAISGIQYAIAYLFMIQLYEWLREGGTFFGAEPGYPSLILLMPVALVGLPLMRTMIWRQRILWAFAIPLALVGAGIAFMEITYANFLDVNWISAIHNDTFSYVPGWGFLVLWLGIFAASILAKWGLRRLSVSKL